MLRLPTLSWHHNAAVPDSPRHGPWGGSSALLDSRSRVRWLSPAGYRSFPGLRFYPGQAQASISMTATPMPSPQLSRQRVLPADRLRLCLPR
jgi:hypothetical protein